MRQLTIDGREVVLPAKTRALRPAQREILRFLRARGKMRPLEAGKIMHLHREPPCYFCADGHCRWCSSDGADALKRLAERGLVLRAARGDWRPVVG